MFKDILTLVANYTNTTMISGDFTDTWDAFWFIDSTRIFKVPLKNTVVEEIKPLFKLSDSMSQDGTLSYAFRGDSVAFCYMSPSG